MPNINSDALIGRGWKEHYSGFPADLFYAEAGGDSPWATTPHLHINYAIGGTLQSLTYKNTMNQNTYLYNGAHFDNTAINAIGEAAIKAEAQHIQGLV
ncbi:MAG TPA: hypothetical protein VKP65_24000 [Rhodothermales bacterium]|nr:hypothetical protein [Rhodothermales bacterium]